MLLKPVLLLVLTCGVVTGVPRAAWAQAAGTVVPLDERVFLIYALEDLSRHRPGEVNQEVHLMEVPTLAWSRFQYDERRIFDYLRRYLQKRKEKDSLDLYQSYEMLVLELLDEKNRALENACTPIYKKLAIEQSAASSRVAMTGLSYALRSVADNQDGETAFVRGYSALLGAYIDEQAKVNQSRAQAALDLTKTFETIEEKFKPKLSKGREDFQKRLEIFAKASKIDNPEFAFQVLKEKTTPFRNPFLLVERARGLLNKKDATVQELMDQAEVCRTASQMVPKPAVYHRHRAAFLSIGALLASQAAAKDLGKTRLPTRPKDAPNGGKLAWRCWALYIKYEPLDTAKFSDTVLQAYILGGAYAGEPKVARAVIVNLVVTPPIRFNLLPTIRSNVSARPDFWFTCARVCSVAGDAALAYECLKQAKFRGFTDADTVKNSDDFDTVRTSSLAADRLGKTTYRDLFNRLFP